MQDILGNLYDFFRRNRWVYFGILLSLVVFIAYGVSKIELEENINSIIPKNSKLNEVSHLLSNSKFADQIIFIVELSDTTKVETDTLKTYAQNLVTSLESDSLVKSIRLKVADETFMQVYDFFYKHIYLYLDDKDYETIQKKLTTEGVEQTVEGCYKTLLSPTGFAAKKFILKDPLSLTPIALEKLKYFQLDDNFVIIDGNIFTKDKKNLLFFLEPSHPSSETKINDKLISRIDSSIDSVFGSQSLVTVQYYGGTAVAVANANVIKSDILLTASLSFILLFLIFYVVFRRIKIIFLLFFPILLGAGFAIAVLTISGGGMSTIALSVGAVLIGMSLDYSLHIFTHFKNCGDIRHTLKDIAESVIMCCMTTVVAFLCLFIVDSEALNQLGAFVAITIFSVATLTLTIVPYLLSIVKFSAKEQEDKTIFSGIVSYQYHKNAILVITVLLLSGLFIYSSSLVRFNCDLTSFNYMPEHLIKAEAKLKTISSQAFSSVYAVTSGKTLEDALIASESKKAFYDECKNEGYFTTFSSATTLMLSQQAQQQKIEKWNAFWASNNLDSIQLKFVNAGKKYKFKDNAFHKFFDNVAEPKTVASMEDFAPLKEMFLSNYLIESDSSCSVVSIFRVDQQKRVALFEKFKAQPDIIVFDKGGVITEFFDGMKTDFDELVWLSMTLVFTILLLFFGRIEIAIITFIPISLSWIWTVGIMGVFGIDFNIFNVIISSFSFGLGIDYSIFIMKGLLNNYKTGNKPLEPYRLSVLLSALTTMAGMGVLILASHPVLKSIAFVSIFGVVSVLLLTNTLLPIMFDFLTRKNGVLRERPLTFQDIIVSSVTLLFFVIGAIILSALVPIIYSLPIRRKTKKYWYHYLLHLTCRFIILVNFQFKQRFIDLQKLDFSKPSVIICNHQSHLDLVIILALNPKVIALTNKWVWDSPFLGLIAKYADFYPVYKGIESGTDRIAQKVKDGYSVLVFPEGSRTPDGSIQRFHQGALSLADELNIPLQPILIHGSYECIPKHEFFLRPGVITLTCYDTVAVRPTNLEAGISYRQQAQELTAFYRAELLKMKVKNENPDFFYRWLTYKYIFKGPILEWYMRVKVGLEGRYEFFNSIIPRNASITDIGCGYGFLPIMLKMVSPERTVTGYDYDEEKIAVAAQAVVNYSGISFGVKNIVNEDVESSDVFILNDILHYMPEEEQMNVLRKCIMKLNAGGKIIVRDANADMVSRTKGTKLTEFFSTKMFGFNKTSFDGLTFISGQKIVNLATEHHMKVTVVDNTRFTSNITYLIEYKVNG